ncbi:hypothetical protein D5086_000481 [Populus alba]|uniref:Uncharacterized protein n=1 Tax=Populus alba TaxID=43335 RepID=A0ACC4CW07_POPAL
MCMSGREMSTTAKLSKSILSQLSSIKITSRNKIKQGSNTGKLRCQQSVYASIRSDHPVRLMRRRLTAPKLLMLPQVQRPNRKSSPLATVTAAAAGVPLPPLDLTEENVKQLGQIFDTSVGITGQVELAELDGPFVVISLKGRFWHERSMVLARIGNYLKQRIPEILEVEIEDEKQLDDSPENF